MMKSALLAFLAATLAPFAAIGFAQGPEKPPGSIKLLPGFTHQRLRGIDTRVGKISRKDGPTIHYDIGKLAGNYAEAQKKEAVWFKEQLIDGQRVQVAFNKNKELTVSFTSGPANFYTTVKSEEDVAEVLLMLFTYTPPQNSN